MDWGDALFCVLAGVLAVGVLRVSFQLQRLIKAVESLNRRP